VKPERSVLLLRRVRTPSGWQRRHIPVVPKSRGWESRLDETLAVWGSDVTELGEYFIRWYERERGRSLPRYQTVGRDYVAAMAALTRRIRRIDLVATAREEGIALPAEVSGTRRLRARLEPFLKERLAKKKITHGVTADMYRKAVGEFLAITEIVSVEEVTREKLAEYLSVMDQRKFAPATQASRYALVSTFLRAADEDLSKLLREFTVRAPEKTPVSYTAEDLKALFAYLDHHPEHRKLALVLELYLKTGLREKELTHLTWDVVDLFHGFLLIQDQRKVKVNRRGGKVEEITFRTKTRRDRKLPIPIEKTLLAKLRRYREEHPHDRFLFPTRQGNPDPANLKKLHRVIREAGLNCGQCEACVSPCRNCRNCRCGKCRHCCVEVNRNTHHRKACLNARLGGSPCTQIECQKWNLHRFRHTFATKALRSRQVDLGMLQHLLGHASLATTQKYLSVATGDEAKAAINRAFTR
jgi:integrase